MQNKIFIGNLPFKITEDDLQEAFSKFGGIAEIKIPQDRATGRTKGFAFVTFEEQNAAEQALSMNGQKIGDREMRVSIANEKKEGGDRGGRSGDRGGRGRSGGGNGGGRGRGDYGREY